MSLLPLPEEINPLLSAKPVVTFSEGYTRQDNIDVPQGPPTAATRPIARLKSKQAPKGEVESPILFIVRPTYYLKAPQIRKYMAYSMNYFMNAM